MYPVDIAKNDGKIATSVCYFHVENWKVFRQEKKKDEEMKTWKYEGTRDVIYLD
jgi:peptidyl-tRNA hydrolase